MKETTLIEMKNKIETLGSITQSLLIEVQNLRTLSFGNSKLLKAMPSYEEAIEKLKAEAAEEISTQQEAES